MRDSGPSLVGVSPLGDRTPMLTHMPRVHWAGGAMGWAALAPGPPEEGWSRGGY